MPPLQRALRDRAGLRRRRLDPNSRVVLRRLRLQGLARPGLERAVRAGNRARNDRPARPHHGRCRCLSRRRVRLRVGRPVPGPTARAPVRRGDRGRPRPACASRSRPSRRTASTSTTPASPPPGTPPTCSPRSATRSRKPLPTGAARPDGGLQAGLADRAGALPDPGSLRPQPAQPGVPQGRAGDAERRLCAAVSRLQLRARRIASFWSGYDLLLTPTLALPPGPSAGRPSRRPLGAVRPGRAVHAVHRRVQRHRPAGDVIAAPLGGRGAPDRRPARRPAARRRAALPRRLATRGRPAVGRPPAAALIDEERTSGTVIPLRERPCDRRLADVGAAAASQRRPTLIRSDWPGARVQHLARVAVADRHRHVPVAVLVEHDVAGPGVGERPGGDGVEALAAELELDLRARDDPTSATCSRVTLSAMLPNEST